MSLHDVPPKATVGFHGQLKIHQRAFVHARERRANPSLRRKIGAERSRLDVERSKAHSAHGYAVAGLQFLRSVLGGHGDASIFAPLFNASNASNLFHNASKHK